MCKSSQLESGPALAVCLPSDQIKRIEPLRLDFDGITVTFRVIQIVAPKNGLMSPG